MNIINFLKSNLNKLSEKDLEKIIKKSKKIGISDEQIKQGLEIINNLKSKK